MVFACSVYGVERFEIKLHRGRGREEKLMEILSMSAESWKLKASKVISRFESAISTVDDNVTTICCSNSR